MLNMLARITKIDEAKRLVYTRVVEEIPDKSGEIFDYAPSKPYFEQWSKDQFEASSGKSYGNVRAMHGKIAAGFFAEPLSFNDDGKYIEGVIKVSDDQEWRKCLDGTYTGASIGGSYIEGSRKTEKIDGKEFVRYTAKPVEVSLVDSPCIPSAKFFDVVKADGTIAKIAFKPPELEVTGTDKEVAEFARVMKAGGLAMADAIAAVKAVADAKTADKAAEDALLETVADMEKREFNADERKSAAKAGAALPDGSFPIKTVGDLKNAVKAYGRAKDKAAAKAHIIKRAKALGATAELPEDWTKDEGKKAADGELKKGMYDVQRLSECLGMLAGIAKSAQRESIDEGDNSPIPAQLRNVVDELVTVFKAMSAEEADEMLAELKEHAGIGENDEIESAVEMAVQLGALRKQLTSPDLPIADLTKIAAEHEEPLTKATLADMPALIGRIMAKAGARNSKADMGHLQAAHDHLASIGANCTASDKAATGDLAKAVSKQLEDALARIKKLEAQPMPSVVTLRMARNVTKEEDNANRAAALGDEIDVNTVELTKDDERVYNQDGSVDIQSSRLMKAMRLKRQQQAPAR